jgi:hypothetical protein
MRLDIAKIDDRIRKLQELKRIVSDPDIAGIISQCLTADDAAAPLNFPETGPVMESAAAPPEREAGAQGRSDGAEALIQSVMAGGQWNRRAR